MVGWVGVGVVVLVLLGEDCEVEVLLEPDEPDPVLLAGGVVTGAGVGVVKL